MSILDTLNNITDKMNKAADKITNSNQIFDNTRGINGLGIVNIDNASATIDSITLDKIKVDNRKLEVNMNKFTDNYSYVQYICQWINQSELGKAEMIDNHCIKVQLHNGICYDIYPCKENTNVDELLLRGLIKANSNIVVLFGYINYTSDQKMELNRMNTQLIGIDEIIEINNAIELADKGIPYIILDKTKLANVIAKCLHDRYNKKGAYNQIISQNSKSIEQNINNFGNRTQEVGTEILNNIKEATKSTKISLDKPDTSDIRKVSLKKENNTNTTVSLKK